jgi:hypothetical protein
MIGKDALIDGQDIKAIVNTLSRDATGFAPRANA